MDDETLNRVLYLIWLAKDTGSLSLSYDSGKQLWAWAEDMWEHNKIEPPADVPINASARYRRWMDFQDVKV